MQLEGQISGNELMGMPNISQSSGSHFSVWMLQSIVREALVISVLCKPPYSNECSHRKEYIDSTSEVPDDPAINGSDQSFVLVKNAANFRMILQ